MKFPMPRSIFTNSFNHWSGWLAFAVCVEALRERGFKVDVVKINGRLEATVW